jgi:hypothetical protein
MVKLTMVLMAIVSLPAAQAPRRASSSTFAAAAATVRLEPEQLATLHMNQVALMELPKTPPTSVIGSAGESLVLVRRRTRRDKTVFVYRAVQTGNHTLSVSPIKLPEGHCISCVTQHYFVTVVP